MLTHNLIDVSRDLSDMIVKLFNDRIPLVSTEYADPYTFYYNISLIYYEKYDILIEFEIDSLLLVTEAIRIYRKNNNDDNDINKDNSELRFEFSCKDNKMNANDIFLIIKNQLEMMNIV